MTHHDTSTDRDREAIDAMERVVRMEITYGDDGTMSADFEKGCMDKALAALRALGMSMPYDEPTEAMVAEARDELSGWNEKWFEIPVAAIRAALVAAAKARGK